MILSLCVVELMCRVQLKFRKKSSDRKKRISAEIVKIERTVSIEAPPPGVPLDETKR